MPRQRYSSNEALNRILRTLKGNTPLSENADQLDGEILSSNQAVSDIAELLNNSLPGESLNIPGGTYGAITSTSTITAEDIVANDAGTFDNLTVSTGAFYAGGRGASIGGFSEPELFGEGWIVLAMGPTSVRPSGTLSHLGGVLFAENGSLLWLGSSGTVTVLAGS